MFITILIILLLAAAVVCVVAGLAIRKRTIERSARRGEFNNGAVTAVVGAALGFIGVLLLIFNVFVTVGTSDVGVETAFGKTVGDLSPGIHLKAPWVAVTGWDGSVQTITYPRGKGCLLVRIGGQQSACLTLTFTYQVQPGASDRLFKAYRGNQNRMQDVLVARTLDSDLNKTLELFSPIEAMAAGNTRGAALSPYAAQTLTLMRSQIGSDIKVGSLFIPYAAYDPATQARLNAFQTQVADTLIAQQAIKTAQAQRTANQDLAASVANPNVIAQQCVTNVLVPLVKAGLNPQGVNCFAGSGGSATVVVPRP